MAHSCPECGMQCYCGSDIDDCLFDFWEDVEACTHCDGADYDERQDEFDFDHESDEESEARAK